MLLIYFMVDRFIIVRGDMAPYNERSRLLLTKLERTEKWDNWLFCGYGAAMIAAIISGLGGPVVAAAAGGVVTLVRGVATVSRQEEVLERIKVGVKLAFEQYTRTELSADSGGLVWDFLDAVGSSTKEGTLVNRGTVVRRLVEMCGNPKQKRLSGNDPDGLVAREVLLTMVRWEDWSDDKLSVLGGVLDKMVRISDETGMSVELVYQTVMKTVDRGVVGVNFGYGGSRNRLEEVDESGVWDEEWLDEAEGISSMSSQG